MQRIGQSQQHFHAGWSTVLVIVQFHLQRLISVMGGHLWRWGSHRGDTPATPGRNPSPLPPTPKVTVFTQAESRKGILCVMYPVCLSSLCQGKQIAFSLSLSLPAIPQPTQLSELCHWGQRSSPTQAHLPQECSLLLVSTGQNRLHPPPWHMCGSMFPSEPCLWAAVTCWTKISEKGCEFSE